MRPPTPRSRRSRALLGTSVAVLLAAAAVVPAMAASQWNRSQNLDHAFVIMMENTGYDSLIGNSNAPWINQAASMYGLATDYHGVTHPSQPNYIAAIAGSTLGVADDSDHTVAAGSKSIVDQLESRGLTWAAYMQSYSLCSAPTDSSCGNQLYERKHNPFISFPQVQASAAEQANIVDLSQLSGDLASGQVANFVWISPDQCHDMHGRGADASDPCAYSNVQDLIATGDAFLQATVDEIMSSSVWASGHSAIFVTWDESDYTGSGPFGFGDTSGCCTANPGGGHVVTIVIDNQGRAQGTLATPTNHYSLLRTIQDAMHLGCLEATCERSQVPSLGHFVRGLPSH